MSLSDTKYRWRLPLAVIYGGRGEEREISKISAESFIGACLKENIPILRVLIEKDGSFYIESEEESPKNGENKAVGGDEELKTPENLPLGGDTYTKNAEIIKECGCAIPRPQASRIRIPTYPVRLEGKSGFLVRGELAEVRGAFPILHGDFGEDGTVQGALITAGIRLFGADTLAGAVSSDKAYTKMIAEHYGIPTTPFVTVTRREMGRAIASCEALGYPLFVKPCSLGSSIGIGIAYNRGELISALKVALFYSERAVCERLIEDKRELECAYFSVGDKRLITPPAEVLVKGFYDYDGKYRRPTEVIPVAEVDDAVKEKIIRYTDTLSAALSVKNISRFDYFLLSSGEILLNEVNSCPGMTESSLYLRMLDAAGLPVSELVSLVWGDPSW